MEPGDTVVLFPKHRQHAQILELRSRLQVHRQGPVMSYSTQLTRTLMEQEQGSQLFMV